MKNEVCQNELIDIIIDLQERGFDHDFVINHEFICCLQYNAMIAPEDFDILETHTCVNNQHACGDYYLYGIRLKNHDIKGILMNKHNSNSDGLSFQLWEKFNTEIIKDTHKPQVFLRTAS